MTSLQETAMGGGPATAKTTSYVLVAADAGTTVAMNAAGATTITVNTGLFAAGDTVFIQNLGAGACTVTAGTATVATAGSLILPQNDAGILYFTATGAAIFYDYIQTAASSALTLIESSTFTSTTSIITGSVFTSTYDNYLIHFTITSAATADGTTSVRLRAGSTTHTTDYIYGQVQIAQDGSVAGAGVRGNVGTSWKWAPSDSGFGGFTVATIANPQNSNKTIMTYSSPWLRATIDINSQIGAAYVNVSTSFDKLDILTQYNVTGFYSIYGYAK
jgi:hypothetical protein